MQSLSQHPQQIQDARHMNYDDFDDYTLLELYNCEQDQLALNVLFQRHLESAFHFAYSYTANTHDAADAVQNAFVQVMRAASTFKQASSVKTWIMAIVCNACQNYRRGEQRLKKREQEYVRKQQQSEINMQAADDNGELQDCVHNLILDMPQRYRVPILMHYIDGVAVEEMAQVMNKSQNAVRKQLQRALEQLRELLKKNGYKSISSASLLALLAGVQLPAAPLALSEQLSSVIAETTAGLQSGAIQTCAATSIASMFAIPAAIKILAIVLLSAGIYLAYAFSDLESQKHVSQLHTSDVSDLTTRAGAAGNDAGSEGAQLAPVQAASRLGLREMLQVLRKNVQKHRTERIEGFATVKQALKADAGQHADVIAGIAVENSKIDGDLHEGIKIIEALLKLPGEINDTQKVHQLFNVLMRAKNACIQAYTAHKLKYFADEMNLIGQWSYLVKKYLKDMPPLSEPLDDNPQMLSN